MDNNKKLALLHKLLYPKAYAIAVKKFLEMRVYGETHMHMFMDFPMGWHAVVGAENRIWILYNRFGKYHLEVEPMNGFLPNGILRRSSK